MYAVRTTGRASFLINVLQRTKVLQVVKVLERTQKSASVNLVLRPRSFHPRVKRSTEAGRTENKCSNICSNMAQGKEVMRGSSSECRLVVGGQTRFDERVKV